MKTIVTKLLTNKRVTIGATLMGISMVAGTAGVLFHRSKKQAIRKTEAKDAIDSLETLRRQIDEKGYYDDGICKEAISVIRTLI